MAALRHVTSALRAFINDENKFGSRCPCGQPLSVRVLAPHLAVTGQFLFRVII
jgi:hypothetical protein